MSLKRECDICGEQQDHTKAKMVHIELPGIPNEYGEYGYGSTSEKVFDACYSCAKKVHKAAERIPDES